MIAFSNITFVKLRANSVPSLDTNYMAAVLDKDRNLEASNTHAANRRKSHSLNEHRMSVSLMRYAHCRDLRNRDRRVVRM
jgi:hypothetical protein